MYGLVNGLWKQACLISSAPPPAVLMYCTCPTCTAYRNAFSEVAIRIPRHPNVYAQRLLNVARALRESPVPEAFSMRWFVYGADQKFPCGTPMCALGHYGARDDLQDYFKVTQSGHLICNAVGAFFEPFYGAHEHFNLTRSEVNELFEDCGCGNARTADDAAAYIERFVAKKTELGEYNVPNYGHGFCR